MAGGENRKRLKSLLKRFIGSSPNEKTEPIEKAGTSKAQSPVVQTDSKEKKEHQSEPQIKKNKEKPPAEKQRDANPTPSSKPIAEDKVAKHWLKAKKGVLKKATQLGEIASLADLHEHSEKRYFIGHQRFSQLMEELVDEELVDYNWDAQEAKVTQKGLDFING